MYNISTFEEKVNSLTPDKVKILEFSGVKKPVKFKCLICGNTSQVAKGEVLLKKNKQYQCNFCHNSKENITKTNCFKIKKAAEKTNKELIFYANTGNPAIFMCKQCGAHFSREPLRFLKNQNCPVCESRVRPPTLSYVKKELQLLGYSLVDEQQYSNLKNKVLLRHTCGFIWKASIGRILGEYSHCPKCSKKNSLGEIKIKKWLDTNKISYIFQWQTKIENRFLYFDFYLPKNNLAIEFQGEQHYKAIDWFGGEEAFKKRKKYDLLKKQWCEKKGIILLEIPWFDYNNIEEILKAQRLISNPKQDETMNAQLGDDIV